MFGPVNTATSSANDVFIFERKSSSVLIAGSVFCVNKVSLDLSQIDKSDWVYGDELPTALLFEFHNACGDCIK